MASNTTKMSTKTMVLGAILTALVIVLQFMGAFIKFGVFSISLVLIPIVIGAATCGVKVSTWLGFVFGIVVLASGDAATFLAINIPGTVITVLAKGTLCGFTAGIVYKALESKNVYLAVIASAIICPITNTAIFLLGCLLFFLGTISEWAVGAGFGGNVALYMIVGFVGFNFLFELLTNIVLSPAVVRLLNIRKKQ